jgi:hypothetical protein
MLRTVSVLCASVFWNTCEIVLANILLFVKSCVSDTTSFNLTTLISSHFYPWFFEFSFLYCCSSETWGSELLFESL